MRVRLKLLLTSALLAAFVIQIEARCDRTPDNNPHPKTQSDGRFRIEISGSPESYVPGEQYTGKSLFINKTHIFKCTCI